jgi:hypothetical protein
VRGTLVQDGGGRAESGSGDFLAKKYT